MHLLDSSAAIALFASNHADHDAVDRWAATIAPLAMCPISEGAVMRYLVRLNVPAPLVRRTIKDVYARHGWSFIADSLSYADSDMDAVAGYRQVTDAYLVALAEHARATLATLDKALAALYPGDAVLIPS
ncbi:MAG: PIN domain-containing protein [Bifidobacteriaceae bacterium]|jgi:predicted nucleic acid-binding protein|nr:PIN domain-containing protein [Bifidobacteriaceae bacterium]